MNSLIEEVGHSHGREGGHLLSVPPADGGTSRCRDVIDVVVILEGALARIAGFPSLLVGMSGARRDDCLGVERVAGRHLGLGDRWLVELEKVSAA